MIGVLFFVNPFHFQPTVFRNERKQACPLCDTRIRDTVGVILNAGSSEIQDGSVFPVRRFLVNGQACPIPVEGTGSRQQMVGGRGEVVILKKPSVRFQNMLIVHSFNPVGAKRIANVLAPHMRIAIAPYGAVNMMVDWGPS